MFISIISKPSLIDTIKYAIDNERRKRTRKFFKSKNLELGFNDSENHFSSFDVLIIEDEVANFCTYVDRIYLSFPSLKNIAIFTKHDGVRELLSTSQELPKLIIMDFDLGSHGGDSIKSIEATKELYLELSNEFGKDLLNVIGITNFENRNEKAIVDFVNILRSDGKSVYNKYTLIDSSSILDNILRDKLAIHDLNKQLHLVTKNFPKTSGAQDIVGNSLAIRKVYYELDSLRGTKVRVLLLGPSGTGKTLMAKHLYDQTPTGDFEKVDCGLFSQDENMLVSMLFGHAKGAYTGADTERIGVFEQFSDGTIFLDEIGNLPPVAQEKLLTILDRGGEVTPLGGSTKKIQFNGRLICATNSDLQKQVAEGKFNAALYSRISRKVIEIPSLKDRKDDIGELANYIINRRDIIDEELKPGLQFEIDKSAIKKLKSYDFPIGNIRELENVLIEAMLNTGMQEGKVNLIKENHIVLPEVTSGTEPTGQLNIEKAAEWLDAIEKACHLFLKSHPDASSIKHQEIADHIVTPANNTNVSRDNITGRLNKYKVEIRDLLSADSNVSKWPNARRMVSNFRS